MKATDHDRRPLNQHPAPRPTVQNLSSSLVFPVVERPHGMVLADGACVPICWVGGLSVAKMKHPQTTFPPITCFGTRFTLDEECTAQTLLGRLTTLLFGSDARSPGSRSEHPDYQTHGGSVLWGGALIPLANSADDHRF